MGICNLSPDSFSGDGLGENVDLAVAQSKQFVADGADIIDVGGESTRPATGARSTVEVEEELRLVIPVIQRLSRELSVPISIDTYKSAVAKEAVRAGATMINDIWALRRDARVAEVAAETGVPLVMMSNQRDNPVSEIMSTITADLGRAIKLALKLGVHWENIIIDPGIGFGKTLEQNLEILRRLRELKSLGRPILLGTSRKSMIGMVLDLPVDQRIEGTAATVAIGIANGADIVRVHEVKYMVRVSRMTDAIMGKKIKETK
ncbi:MAG: dihydropteroate synthase [Chloroflexi bacterium]|nr:dihydropteroate synthase [Chloroflexota bacterium]